MTQISEIDYHIGTTKGIKWKAFMAENFIPSDIILKYRKRIFVTGSYIKVKERQILIAEMFKRNNEKMSTELFEALLGDSGVSVFGDYDAFNALAEVFDVDDYLDNVQINACDGDYNNEFNTVHTVSSIQLLGNEYSFKAYQKLLVMYPDKKRELLYGFYRDHIQVKASDAFLCNQEDKQYSKEYIDSMTKELRDYYENSFNQESIIPNFGEVFSIFGLDEIIERSTPEKLIIHTFKYRSDIIQRLDKVNQETIDKLAQKLLQTTADDEALKEIEKSCLHGVVEFASKTSFENELYKKFITNKGVLYGHIKDLDWQEVGFEFSTLSLAERARIFSRTDVPDWFLNQFSAQLMHILFLKQNGLNDMIDERNAMQSAMINYGRPF